MTEMTKNPKENAAAYVRMSDPRQDGSPAQQKSELKKLAKEYNCEIIKTYTDEGKSGSKDQHKRIAFQQMISDAEKRNDFTIILCRDMDRFGRFGPREANYYWEILARSGVRIITAAQGEILTDDLGEWLKASVIQHGKHQYSKDVSRNMVGGLVQRLQNKRPIIVKVPYGLLKRVTDEHGKFVRDVGRAESFHSPSNWNATLVPGDDEEVERVKWMFDTYANTQTSLRKIATILNGRGAPSSWAHHPNNSGKWSPSGIRTILTNCNYVGDYRFGVRRTGAFNFFSVNGVVKREKANAGTLYNPESDQFSMSGIFEPIIDRKTFGAVQKRLAGNQVRTSPAKNRTFKLSGLLYCGHCGYHMRGVWGGYYSVKGQNVRVDRYACGLWLGSGPGSCNCYSIREDHLFTLLVDLIQDVLTRNIGDVKKRVAERLKARESNQPAAIKRLQSKVGKLDREIKLAVKRLIRCDDAVVDLLSNEIAEMRAERQVLQDDLQSSVAACGVTATVDLDEVVKELWTLSGALKSADPDRAKEVLHRAGDRVDLYWGHIPGKKTHKYPLERGVITLSPSLAGLYNLSRRGDVPCG